ncbi:MAG: SDR family oxidoreductase [Myxococcota bacterium]
MDRRIAFVTGASRGIGAATSLALAERGFDVVVTARTLREGEGPERGADGKPIAGSLETTAAGIRERGREALTLRLDLLDSESIEAAVVETEKRWGPVEVLVNNGIYQGDGTMAHVLDLEVEEFERLYRGNVTAPVFLAQRVLPGMLAMRRGGIVNLVSEAGMTNPRAPAGQGGWGFAYASSKAALQRLVGVLTAEHPDCGLRFVNVQPGFTITESMRARGIRDQFEMRGAPPEACAEVIAWLVTDPRGAEWQGRSVHSQKLCEELGLLPDWPPPAE